MEQSFVKCDWES